MGNADSNNSGNGLLSAFRADPKKSGVLAVLLIVLFATVGRMVLSGGRKGPASAMASMSKREPLVGSQQSRSAFANSQRQLAANASALQKWSQTQDLGISRNLFAVRMEYFPIDGSRTAQTGSEDGFWSKLEKSMMLQADQKDKRENLRANVTALAEKLKVQSTMMGPTPRAMVNGEFVGEGSVVADFRVLKIESRRIIVEREGIRLEILMK